ncbi:MAG: phosphatidate cytidylyltransferase [Ginsengibacter sp.]
MAVDINTFKTRAGTAIIFAAIMLAGLLWNGWSFILLFTLIHFGCWYEYIKLIKKIKPLSYQYLVPLGLLYITMPILMLLYCGFPQTADVLVSRDNISSRYSPIIPCGIIFSIWINDTMAYIVGSFIGKTPLSKISPKKTWEGTVGGMILCVITITLIGNASGYLTWFHWMAISLCCAIAGTLGDLLESKLKRMAGVKDSGAILPGHGGFLDRFDSLLVAIPFVFVYYFLFIQ